ncbi:M23 family metallopeptidase [Pseudonocardia acidicola]|uniref:M23 family metallopeptidase n=1 Tax=Pseudonocardia acidicola TaxID=2724939 RepID=A0ABX1SBA3_9PSEU|nr:M23 family metallopeptidase [Pseudonocardia acidicola]
MGDTPPSERTAPNPRGSIGYDVVLRKGKTGSSLSAPHHDHPAIGMTVVSGTPFHVITSGTATRPYQAGGCGIGVTLRGDDGATCTYCHATRITAAGTVTGGRLGLTGSAGNSTGPHLHLQMRYPASTLRCPQPP